MEKDLEKGKMKQEQSWEKREQDEIKSVKRSDQKQKSRRPLLKRQLTY
jgi:hypothetical protein